LSVEWVEIGPHRLACGDCLEVLPTLGKVDAVVTDPPYGIGFYYEDGKEASSNPQDYAAFVLPVIARCRIISNPGAFFAVWQAALNFRHFWTWFGDDIRIYAAAKNFVQLRKTPINYAYDPVVMWYQPGKPLRPEKPKRSVDYFVANTAGIISDTTRIEKGHPCPRPLDAVSEVVSNFTLPGGVILDPFMGSGTTGVACHSLERRFIGIEKEPKYFDIACRRIESALKSEPLLEGVA
jgi:site-specific DNA-methyltransferase (adenine-specific)